MRFSVAPTLANSSVTVVPQVAAARHGNFGAMEAAQQGSHDGGGSAHLGNELVGGLP